MQNRDFLLLLPIKLGASVIYHSVSLNPEQSQPSHENTKQARNAMPKMSDSAPSQRHGKQLLSSGNVREPSSPQHLKPASMKQLH